MKLNEILDDLGIKDHRQFIESFNVAKLDEIIPSLAKYSKEKINLLNLNTKKVEEFKVYDVFAKVLLNKTAKKMYAIPSIDGIEIAEKVQTTKKVQTAKKTIDETNQKTIDETIDEPTDNAINEDNFEVSQQDVEETKNVNQRKYKKN